MAKRFPLLCSCKKFVKYSCSINHSPNKAAIVGSNRNANALVHTAQGGDSILAAATEGEVKAREVVENVVDKAKESGLEAANKSAELVRRDCNSSTIITAEADTNVVDTVEYRCTEDLGGHLGDGHDT
ncbi:hypothetical protein Fmac_018988 [Flemingia macrophylla]|uniref:Uncharacterized protein n=1 Tax=Flemingia macrophylla TaxID=520843 RepID=A0ABD1M6H5_9FABA